jgi:ABC-type Fe3+ transport system permease subunit
VASAPLFAFIVAAFTSGGAEPPSPAGAHGALDGRRLELLARSLFVAGASTLLALLWGLPTALAVSRLRGPAAAALEVVSYLPLLLPNMAIVMGWVYFCGRDGHLTRALRSLTGSERAPVDLYTPLGAAFVLSLSYFPCVSIFGAQGFRSVPASELRAASLVPRSWCSACVFWGRRLGPQLATGCLLVFVLSLSDYGVPAALMVNVYPVEVLAQLSSLRDPDQALALSLPPLVLVAVLCSLRHFAARPAPPAALAGTTDEQPRCPRLALWTALAALALSTLVPMVFLLLTAGPPESYVRALRTAGDQVLASVETGAWTALVLLALALAFAAGFWSSGPVLRRLWESAALFLLAVPGSIVGLGILSLRHLWPWSLIRDHAAVTSYAAACRYLAFPALLLSFAAASLKPCLLQAGSISGAGPWRLARGLLLPLLLPAVLAAATLSFVLGLGELTAAVVVYPPGGMTLPVRLASLLHFGEEAIVAALTAMLSGFGVGCLVLCQLLMNRPLRLDFSATSQP